MWDLTGLPTGIFLGGGRDSDVPRKIIYFHELASKGPSKTGMSFIHTHKKKYQYQNDYLQRMQHPYYNYIPSLS